MSMNSSSKAPSRRPLALLFSFACVLATTATGCGGASKRVSDRYDRQQLYASLSSAAPAEAGLVIGEYPLAAKAIVDGDTIRVHGLDASLRLLAIDTEETFKTEKDLRLYRAGFDQYLETLQGDSERPVKCATPLGMEAKKFAESFFKGVTTVRLERDHPKEIRDHYNRYLAYILVQRDGKWVNYNVEAVRAGMTPYFSKYGYSRRYHDDFVKAQEEARAAGRGIWDPTKEHYRDYPLRLEWWDARAEYLAQFEQKEDASRIVLTRWDAADKLEEAIGKEVYVLGSVAQVHPRRGRAPAKALLSFQRTESFPLVFFSDDVFEKSGVAAAEGEHIVVRGKVSVYERPMKRDGKKNGATKRELQIVVRHPDQISINEAPQRILAAAHAKKGKSDAPGRSTDANESSAAEPVAAPTPTAGVPAASRTAKSNPAVAPALDTAPR